MSYDIRLCVKIEGLDNYAEIDRPAYDSPTYNLREMFVKAMDWDYEQSKIYPVTEVLPKIERGLHELRFNSQAYKSLEPENGWGNIDSAIECLESLLILFSEYSTGYKCGTNGLIPLENLYFRW